MQRQTHLIEFDDVRVVEQLHNLHFPVDFLQIGRVQSGLVNNLDGHLSKWFAVKLGFFFAQQKNNTKYVQVHV